MLIALFSDIHANLPALEAALHEAERRGAGRVLFAGDAVGKGPHPAEVAELLRRLEIASVRGNVDRKVLGRAGVRGRVRALLANAESARKRHHLWTAQQLDKHSRRWLRELPGELDLRIARTRIRLVHGSPLGDTDYIYPSITAAGLRAKLGYDRPDVLVCGHSHIPFTRLIEGVRVVNCGSVGRPYDGDPRGSFALLELGAGRRDRRAEIVRFAYDVERTARDVEAREVPGVSPDNFRRGVKGIR